MFSNTSLLLACILPIAAATCYEPSPAFPIPSLNEEDLKSAFPGVETNLRDILEQKKYESSSVSIEVTSGTGTLWGAFHTAKVFNETRPGDQDVSSSSLYRIASITKTFTTLAILHQHDAGNLSLDDPVIKHIPELNSSDFSIPWKDITIRSMASQLSGIPREFGQSDLLNLADDALKLGLPPASKESLPPCDEYNNYKPCGRADLLKRLKTAKPLFAPNQKSTYSNVNFDLLGLVIEQVTGMPYEEYIAESILKPLGMDSSSFSKPSDKYAVLPVVPGTGNYWDIDEGVQNPTGGLYSCSCDMSKFVRYILTHFNNLATGVNWLMPGSWATGMNSFYGMPFEIFRSDRVIEESRRPITFVTKSGGLPGYFTRIIILEEFNLGITILVGGNPKLLDEINELVTVSVVQAAEAAVWSSLAESHTGSFAAVETSLNSSLTLTASPSQGLRLTAAISNSTDILNGVLSGNDDDFASSAPWHVQLVPTLLYKNEATQQGEIWRMLIVHERVDDGKVKPVWDDQCVTDVDQISYAGLPINEIVFWLEDGLVELPAWKVTMKMDGEKHDEGEEYKHDLYECAKPPAEDSAAGSWANNQWARREPQEQQVTEPDGRVSSARGALTS
ncbi:beta-lactamase family protein [Zymoseptoria brevis]|uniref:Beta-lactamase family protein n=1 Tax=Zymoseptoria brevis TaxID=1047168 RepID=A0A0F4GU01_9PEZI|nr:beta-lactamase family protein [Zymoseptoria brevis]